MRLFVGEWVWEGEGVFIQVQPAGQQTKPKGHRETQSDTQRDTDETNSDGWSPVHNELINEEAGSGEGVCERRAQEEALRGEALFEERGQPGHEAGTGGRVVG